MNSQQAKKNSTDKETAPWWLYMLRTANGSLYTGITLDVARRIQEHSSGKRGAKALRGKGPLKLEFSQQIGSRSAALSAEYAVKQLTKSGKEALILAGKMSMPATQQKKKAVNFPAAP